MSRITPGKWEVYIVTMPTLENGWCSEIDIIDHHGRTLAEIRDWGEQKANAQAMAALPELVETLEFFMLIYGNTGYSVTRENAKLAYDKGKKVLNKVEGKE